MSEQEIEKILQETPLFSTLDEEKIKEIAKISEKRSFNPNEFTIHEGDIASSFFLILDGQVEVQRRAKSIRRMGRGQFFGETTLARDESRSADVVAIQPTTCLKLSSSQLKELIEINPQIAIKLLEEMIKRNRTITKESAAEEQDKMSSSEQIFDFGSESARQIFENLVDSFIRDYMVKKFVSEKCGWRSVPEISRQTGASLSVLYGKQGGVGSAFEEPIRRGLVETRFFPGERGRGGEIMRFRVAYEKEPIKSYVNQKIRDGRKSPKV